MVDRGPAGLACADQLNKNGYQVTVYEKDEKIGGLLRFGIPDFKLEKKIIDRRVKILEEEGVNFQKCVLGKIYLLKDLTLNMMLLFYV